MYSASSKTSSLHYLSAKVPGHEGDALEASLTLPHSLVVGPVTDHNANGGEVTLLLVRDCHPGKGVGVTHEVKGQKSMQSTVNR